MAGSTRLTRDGDLCDNAFQGGVMTKHDTSTIRIGDRNLQVMRGGAGEPMLWLHDATQSGIWLDAMDRLAERFDLIVPEHPGFGLSDIPPWLDTVGDLANFYLDFLAALKLTGVHLIGTSLGGWIAAELAIRNTSRLASLTLVDASGIRVPGVSGIDSYVTGDEQTIRDLFHDQARADRTVAAVLHPDHEDALLKNKLVTAKLTWQPRLYDPHLMKWLHRIDVPTLIVWGENDRVLPQAIAEAWQRGIPGAQRAMIAQCGHLPAIERPDQFTAAITSFLSAQRVPA